jgi:2-polyprenyl-3-methyl-5-hydroxy-6-metoxy-1,4-benzoquinol methylase
MANLESRSSEAEIMDDLNCSGEVLDRTLRELEFINKWLGGNAVTINAISRLFRNLPKNRTYRIIDVGCGGGDMARHIWEWGKRNGFSFEIVGVDANPNAIRFAQNNIINIPSITFRSMNIFAREFRDMQCDVVIGTLFFHHFSREELTDFFSSLRRHVSLALIINDIHRHPLAFHSIRILTRLFSRSSMVKNDAPLSVRRSFSKRELQDILSSAGYRDVSIHWKWAFRWEVIASMK